MKRCHPNAALLASLFLCGTAVAAPPASRPATTVYAANFDVDLPGPQWSSTDVAATADGKRRFLGPFVDRPVLLLLGRLPPHVAVRVVFDLLTYDRWNGDSSQFGRDLWDMRVVGGQPLVHTTFSNCGFFINNNEQSYPDQYPWYPTHDGFTGAATKQSLGWVTGQGPQQWGCDSTYAIDVTFPHTADTLQLQFASQIKRHEDKPYGFLTFRVETVDRLATATDAQLAGWWADLAGEDPVRANGAVWKLVATGDAATAYAEGHLPTALAADPAPVKVDPTARWTPGGFTYATPASRQMARALHVLEAIGTPRSLKLMRQAGYAGTPTSGPPDQWTPEADAVPRAG